MSTYHDKDDIKFQEFSSNIERIGKVIQKTIGKGQYQNSKRYIDFLTDSQFRFCKKFEAQESSKVLELNSKSDTPLDIEVKYGSFVTTIILYPNVIEALETYLNIYKNISVQCLRTNDIQTFRELFDKILDVNSRMLREGFRDSIIQTSLRYYNVLADQLTTVDYSLSKYEISSFHYLQYEWFFSLYDSNIEDNNRIELLENTILNILRIWINNGRDDLFKEFLLSMSHRLYSMRLKDVEFDVNSDLPWKEKFEIQIRANKLSDQSKKIYSLKEYKKFASKISSEFGELKKMGIDPLILDTIEKQSRLEYFENFKENYLKVLLFKAVIYSVFKKQPLFFEHYLNYHSPDDNEAIWSNPYFGVSDPQELFILVSLNDQILNDKDFFWVDHHGFEIYFRTLVLFYISYFNSEKISSSILGINKDDLRSINFFFKKILERGVDERYLGLLFEKLDIESAKRKLTSLSEEIEIRLKELTHKEILSKEIDVDIYAEFQNKFLERFNRVGYVRDLLKYFGLVELNDLPSKVSDFGLNRVMDKQPFIKQNDIYFFNIGENFGESMANAENSAILKAINEKCQPIKIEKKALQYKLRELQQHYDTLITFNRVDFLSSIEKEFFKESWSFESEFNTAFYLGKLFEKINVFAIPFNSKYDFMLISSCRLGKLNQYQPGDLPDAEVKDIFKFSILDLAKHPETKSILEAEGHKDLETKVWLRVFEKFEFIFSNEFDGLVFDYNS